MPSTLRSGLAASILFVAFVAPTLAQEPVPVPPEAAPTTSVSAPGHPPPGTRVAVPEPSDKAVSYFRGGVAIWVVSTLLGLLIPGAILFSGLSARLRNLARGLGRRWYFTFVIYIALFTALTWLLDLPLAYYTEFVRQHAYGLSNQTLAKWASDAAKHLVVGIVLGGMTLWIPYLLIRKSPRRWWLWTSVVAVPAICGLVLVQPILIDPLFNDFGPMNDRALEAKILAIADRAGIEGGRVFEVAKSEDTKAVNAYVTGFMGTKRIVLWDTIISKLDERQLLFVMAHEMGHYVLGHVWRGILLAAVGICIVLYAAHRLSRSLIARFGRRFGFTELGDVASLPLIILIANLSGLLGSPLLMAYSRMQEHEADRFGLELTRDNWAGASAFVRLQEENLSIPRPPLLHKIFRATHPPLGERIDFSNDYRPWETGAPRKYERLFR